MALKEENLKVKTKKIKKYTNKRLYGFLITCVILYTFFFLSNLFLPPTFEGVDTLKVGSSVEVEQRKLTLLSWTYSKKQEKMEVILGLENLSLDKIKKYKWQVIDKFGEKKSKVIIEDEDIIVINIYDIKENFTELKLLMGIREEDKNLKTNFPGLSFYTSSDIVSNVDSIKEKSKEEYKREAYNSVIKGYEREIKKEEKAIGNYEDKITVAKEKIATLNKEMKYQTSGEKEITIEKILEITDKEKDYKEDIKDSKKKIAELKKKIELKKKQIEEKI